MTSKHDVTPAKWLVEPLAAEVSRAVQRLCHSDDVNHVALMPDIHLAEDVCIGTVVATEQLIYPMAVGGDIGCGMAALAINVDAGLIDNQRAAARVLSGLYQCVPCNKHRKPLDLPDNLDTRKLSNARLRRIASREGRVQLGTLGRGNHFLEFQSDQKGQLWIMIHSGSRGLGQAITEHHLRNAQKGASGLLTLDGKEDSGSLYLSDVGWARTYAAENRLSMLRAVAELLAGLFEVAADWDSLIHCDHNHVQQEVHFGKQLWVHRKGAQSARDSEPGIIPGSMGTASFHTTGRGVDQALMSCSHGAGRKLSRTEARKYVTAQQFSRQVGELWFDQRRAGKLRDEAPSAYKDIRQVMKAQRDLARIVRELRPLLSYKGH